MRIKAGMVFLPQADQAAQAGHVEVHIQSLPVALRAPNGFGQRVHHIVSGTHPVSGIAALQLVVDGADAGRLVDVALFLYRKVQRQMQEGIGFALLRRPVVLEVAFDIVEIMVIFGVGFDDAQGFLLEFVQLQRGKALPPYIFR